LQPFAPHHHTTTITTNNIMTSKVFVGNLAFQTTDQALAEAFQDCGKVKSGVVITRGRRSLGYGFVEFESHESALEAVKSKNNVELKGRHLKVELASENPVRPNLERGPSGAGGGNPNPGRSSSPGQGGISSAAAANQNPGSAGDNAGGPSGQRRKQRPFPPRNQQQQQQQQRRKGPVKAVVVDNTQNPNSNPGSNNKAPQNPSTGSNPASGGNPPAGNNKPTAAGGDRSSGDNNSRRPPRPPRERRERNYNKKTYPETRVLSKTAVFVANLPFNVKDDELTNFFKDNKPKAAHVVTTRTGRSRGYGFVDFETENDQQAAILSKNNLMFPQSDRQITVTASYKTQEVVVNVV
jgi:RNA recognition motif-containing protein